MPHSKCSPLEGEYRLAGVGLKAESGKGVRRTTLETALTIYGTVTLAVRVNPHEAARSREHLGRP